jgi:ABC-type amino acid transport substrate-binding protein
MDIEVDAGSVRIFFVEPRKGMHTQSVLVDYAYCLGLRNKKVVAMKNSRLSVLMVVFAAVCAMIFQPQAVSAADRLATIRSRGEVRVCIWPDYFAISYRNPRTGELEGIDIDMAREFARNLGVRLTIVDSSFAKLVENMTNDAAMSPCTPLAFVPIAPST